MLVISLFTESILKNFFSRISSIIRRFEDLIQKFAFVLFRRYKALSVAHVRVCITNSNQSRAATSVLPYFCLLIIFLIFSYHALYSFQGTIASQSEALRVALVSHIATSVLHTHKRNITSCVGFPCRNVGLTYPQVKRFELLCISTATSVLHTYI